ncbi:hypothetical protein L195_g034795 [Trifolium pratense]|uniref:Uncharacterized protein n=1 Tax=Trifolium pratense TaxID=57577 RepID=A0A2K3LJT9_TRIPR|nr:hypothetical protein L195_g034795 [Trifolium pratense]
MEKILRALALQTSTGQHEDEVGMIQLTASRDPTVVLEPIVRRMVQPTSCIKSLPEKDGQTTCHVECGKRQCKYICVLMKKPSAIGRA